MFHELHKNMNSKHYTLLVKLSELLLNNFFLWYLMGTCQVQTLKQFIIELPNMVYLGHLNAKLIIG
jgi:hypothetical protein